MKNGKVRSEGRVEPIFTILNENCFGVYVLQNQRCTWQKINLMYADPCRCDQIDFVYKNTEHFYNNENRGFE